MRSVWVHYGLAVVALAVVILLRVGLEQAGLVHMEGRPLLLFVLPVILAAWWGGLGPGLFATALAAAVAGLLSVWQFDLSLTGDPDHLAAMTLFVLQGVFLSWLIGTRRQAMREAEQSRTEQEQRVDLRTAALRQSNAALLDQMDANELVAQELRQQSEQLRRSNQELQDFASVASHDLQEPLRKIQAFGDRLRVRCSEQLGDDGRDYLARMQGAAGRMSVLINDLLTFSRVTTKARPFEPTDLGPVVDAVVSDLEARIEQTGGTVDVGPLPTVEADATQMRQLFQNLISNGLKFHRDDIPPVVRITAESLGDGAESGRGFCEIRVTDNGIGFDEKYLDRIFEIFQRLHGRNTYEGTGIGLAVCRKIVERHGGQITADSRPGQGATFLVRLPVRQDILTDPTTEPLAYDSPAPAHHDPAGR